jgi:hypothetical protein
MLEKQIAYIQKLRTKNRTMIDIAKAIKEELSWIRSILVDNDAGRVTHDVDVSQ